VRPDPDPDAAVAELDARLARYPASRYPVQHATAQFHRGRVLIESGRPADGEGALRRAAELFAGLPHEQAKACNLLGVALREQGRLDDAHEAFEEAQAAFAAERQPLDEGAATYNLGLVQAQSGDAGSARRSFERARQLFAEHGAPGKASAAGRELGAVLLAAGDAEGAVEALEEASKASDRVGDEADRGLTTNALGLARLAAGHVGAAVESFRRAAAAHPRTVRPQAYAMAKANLALAYEQAGDAPRARLAAEQARGTPGADGAVVSQAAAVLERCGPAGGDLHAVLDDERADRWLPLVREEVVRWADADPAERRREVATWIEGQLARPDRAPERAEAWLGVLLELPPTTLERLVRAALSALGDHDDEARARFRRATSRAMARFNPPQMLRLEAVFSATAEELGQDGSWR
jgi:tetratricopeptide (TPR) repeat protein